MPRRGVLEACAGLCPGAASHGHAGGHFIAATPAGLFLCSGEHSQARPRPPIAEVEGHASGASDFGIWASGSGAGLPATPQAGRLSHGSRAGS